MKKSDEIFLGYYLIKCEDPVANNLLKCANKWLRRIEERRDELPKSFFRDCDPAPLRKEIDAHLKSREEATHCANCDWTFPCWQTGAGCRKRPQGEEAST